MRVALTGSTGLIGTALRTRLDAAGHTVVPVVRRAAGPDEIAWDPLAGEIDAGRFRGVDAVVHLAGAGIGDKRWTDERKREIRDSRVLGTRLLAETLASLTGDGGPGVLLSGSAIGFYGDRGDDELDESSGPGEGFLADVVSAWEASTAPAEEAGLRVAHLRTGIVLSPAGGALGKQLPLFKLGLGGRFGSGRQWQSWISIDDEVRAIEHLLTADVAGPVNLTAPTPVRNREFAATLGRVLRRPAVVPVPRVGPALLLGFEAAEQLLFVSQRIRPRVLAGTDHEFAHPDLETALRALLDR